MAAEEIIIPEIHKVQIVQEATHERSLSWGRSTSVIDDDAAAATGPAPDALPADTMPADTMPADARPAGAQPAKVACG